MNAKTRMAKDDHDDDHDARKRGGGGRDGGDGSHRKTSKTRLVFVLAIILALIASTPLLAFAQATTAGTTTTTETLTQVATTTPNGSVRISQEEQSILETQDVALESITKEEQAVNSLEFTPRWGGVATLEPNQVDVLFADCLANEFAVSAQHIFEAADISIWQSFPIGLPTENEVGMSWLMVVENTGSTERAASAGVICVGEGGDGGGQAADNNQRKIGTSTKILIDETVKNYVKLDDRQIVNINEIINIRQTLVQNAIQIVEITGSNNTVNQVISQTANQIVNANITSPTQIQQIINQNAEQRGIIPSGSTLNQQIEQNAQQSANVTAPTTAAPIAPTITPPAPPVLNQTLAQQAQEEVMEQRAIEADEEAQAEIEEQLVEEETEETVETEVVEEEVTEEVEEAPATEDEEVIEEEVEAEEEVATDSEGDGGENDAEGA